MSSSGNQQNRNVQYAINLGMAGIAGQVGCVTLIIVFVALFAGLWLDRLLDSKPVFTILLLLGSAPFSLFLTFWLATRAVKNIKPLPPAGAQTEKKKEEETGE